MKKLYFGLFIVIFILFAAPTRAQVFGYPGATWVFHAPGFLSICANYYEVWEYTGDTVIFGENAKILCVTSKQSFFWDSTQFYPANHFSRFFKVSSDTVSILNMTDTTWVELYNFSLGIGDSVTSPIDNFLNGFSNSCSDSLAYSTKAVVTDTGTIFIDGQNLRYYTLQYIYTDDSSIASVTIYERFITYGYWYPIPYYVCNTSDWCDPPGLLCYKDSGMITDSICSDVSWIETLSLQKESANHTIVIYPNPVHDILSIQNPQPENYQILSCDGRLIAIYNGNSINVTQLPSGLYFICDENRTWFKKFIKN